MNRKPISNYLLLILLISLFAAMSATLVFGYHTVTGYVVDTGNKPSVDKITLPKLPTHAALIIAGVSNKDPLYKEKKAYVDECVNLNRNLGILPAYLKSYCECLFENDAKPNACASYLFGKQPETEQTKGKGQTKAQPKDTYQPCTDTDGGKDPLIKGTAKGMDLFNKDNPASGTDTCNPAENQLVEFLCEKDKQDGKEYVAHYWLDCPEGTKLDCKQAICVSVSPNAPDTGAATNIDKKVTGQAPSVKAPSVGKGAGVVAGTKTGVGTSGGTKGTSTDQGSSQPSDVVCTDSDDGNNLEVKGVTSGLSAYNEKPVTAFDSCKGNQIMEQICQKSEKTGKVYVVGKIQPCPSGSCQDGACVKMPASSSEQETTEGQPQVEDKPLTVTCEDSDNGADAYVKGTLTYKNLKTDKVITASDICRIKESPGLAPTVQTCSGEKCVVDDPTCFVQSANKILIDHQMIPCPQGCTDGVCTLPLVGEEAKPGPSPVKQPSGQKGVVGKAKKQCAEDRDCPPGQVCDSRTNMCVGKGTVTAPGQKGKTDSTTGDKSTSETTDTTGTMGATSVGTGIGGMVKVIQGVTTGSGKKLPSQEPSVKSPGVGKTGVTTATGAKTGQTSSDSGSKSPQPGKPTGKTCDDPTDCGSGQVCDKATGMCVWSENPPVISGGVETDKTTNQPSCIDSDNSQSITKDPSWMVKGYSLDTTYNVKKEDACETLNGVEYLMESTCYNNFATYKQVKCSVDLGKEYTCKEGVCAKIQIGTEEGAKLPKGVPTAEEALENELLNLVLPSIEPLPFDTTVGKKEGDMRKTPESTPTKKEFIKECMAKNSLKVPAGQLRNFCACLFDNNNDVTLCKRLLNVGKEGQQKRPDVEESKKGLPAYDTDKKKPDEDASGTSATGTTRVGQLYVVPTISVKNLGSLVAKFDLPVLSPASSADGKPTETTKDKEAQKTKYVKECLTKNDKLLADKAKLRGFCACLYDNRGKTDVCKQYLATRPKQGSAKETKDTVRPTPKPLPAFDISKLPVSDRKKLESHRDVWSKKGANSRNKSDQNGENACMDRLKKNKKIMMQFNDNQIKRACDCLTKGKSVSVCLGEFTSAKKQASDVVAEAQKELGEAEKQVDQQEQQAENTFVNGCVVGVKGLKEFADFTEASIGKYCACLFDQGKECLSMLETTAAEPASAPETMPEQEPETEFAEQPVEQPKQCPLLSQVCDYVIDSKDLVSLYPGAETEVFKQGYSLKIKFVEFGSDGKSCVTQFTDCNEYGCNYGMQPSTMEQGMHINYGAPPTSIDVKMDGAYCLE